MARGNQRELARQKNMKKSQEISKGKRKDDSLTASQRKQRSVIFMEFSSHQSFHFRESLVEPGRKRDSEIMQQKQKAANEKKSMQTRQK
nr:PREDICTED: small EDRK-rich factor 1 isoform X1 [Rhinolophus sinicus]